MDWARSGAPVRISSLIRTFTVGSGIAPDQLALADSTAGLELRHASKMGQRFRLLRDPAKDTQAKPRGAAEEAFGGIIGHTAFPKAPLCKGSCQRS